MRNLKVVLAVVAIVAGISGCGKSQPNSTLTPSEVNQIRHPSHVPPPGYKPDTSGGAPPPAKATSTE